MLGFELRNNERKKIQTSTRLHCMQACLSQRDFECRSVNYDPDTGDCSLSDMDRASIVPTHDMKSRTYGPSAVSGIEFIENNCIEGKCVCARKQCSMLLSERCVRGVSCFGSDDGNICASSIDRHDFPSV